VLAILERVLELGSLALGSSSLAMAVEYFEGFLGGCFFFGYSPPFLDGHMLAILVDILN